MIAVYGVGRSCYESFLVSDPESRGNLNTMLPREGVNVVTSIMDNVRNKYEVKKLIDKPTLI